MSSSPSSMPPASCRLYHPFYIFHQIIHFLPGIFVIVGKIPYICDKKLKRSMSKTDYINILQGCSSTLRNDYGIKSLRLFGSVARGEDRESSDVDVFVQTETPNPFLLMDAKDFQNGLLGVLLTLFAITRTLIPACAAELNEMESLSSNICYFFMISANHLKVSNGSMQPSPWRKVTGTILLCQMRRLHHRITFTSLVKVIILQFSQKLFVIYYFYSYLCSVLSKC